MLSTNDITVNKLIKSAQRQTYHPYKPLGPAEIDLIHETSMEVFNEIGFKVHLPEVFEILRKIGASVDSHERIVRLSESMVMELISSIPPELTLYARQVDHDIHLGSGNVYFGTGGTALNVLDYETNQQRAATLSDLFDIVRLVDCLDNIHLLLLPTYPNDLPIDKVDINRFMTGLANTKKHIMGGVYTSQGIRDVIAMAEIIAGSAEALRERPFISMITCGISPLVLDSKYGALMIQVAKENIPLAVPVEPLCGATAPITLAGNLVIQNCDALIHLMTTQIVNPGAPVLYGCVATSTERYPLLCDSRNQRFQDT
jgi:trimethylamine--corrinoid protein Co-methyltransferase